MTCEQNVNKHLQKTENAIFSYICDLSLGLPSEERNRITAVVPGHFRSLGTTSSDVLRLLRAVVGLPASSTKCDAWMRPTKMISIHVSKWLGPFNHQKCALQPWQKMWSHVTKLITQPSTTGNSASNVRTARNSLENHFFSLSFFLFAVSIHFPGCHVVFWDFLCFSLVFYGFTVNVFVLFLTVFECVSPTYCM